MKIQYSICLALTLLFSSCESWLDKKPLDRLYPEVFFTNEAELKLYSNTFYSSSIYDAKDLYEESYDVIVITKLANEVLGDSRSAPTFGGSWNYEALRDINFLLENSNHCEDLAVRAEYDAVAKFFRAFFYHLKMQRFGEVPLYDYVLGSTDEELYKPRDSRDDVMEQIISDIDYAIEHLPATKSLYRVTKWSALALKTRMCLFEGTFRKYHNISDYEPYLTLAAEAGEEFINSSSYSISTSGDAPYAELFGLDANATEVILARDYDVALGLTHNVQNYEVSTSTGRPGLTKNIVNTYLMKDGSRFTEKSGYETMEFIDECKDRDPRLAQTIRTPGYTYNNAEVAPSFTSSWTGYQLTKFTVGPEYEEYDRSANDFPILRTAEVYLNFAEAKAELGTLTQDDLDKSIKHIRDRVGMPNIDMAAANAAPDQYLVSAETGYPNVTGDNQGVILEIRRERTIELLMEGHRYFDIVRWHEGMRLTKPFLGMYFKGAGEYDLNSDGKLDVCLYVDSKPATTAPLSLKIGEQIHLTNGNSGNVIVHKDVPRNWNEERDYLYRIPLHQRELTNGALSQNPGWDDGLIF